MWVLLSLLSALVAGVTAVVVKGVSDKVDSTLGFGIQAIVILLCTWGIISVQGKASGLSSIDGKSWFFLIASGAVTTVAYLFYFAALKAGNASQVAPLDRLSLVFTIVFAAIFLGEKITPQIIGGAALMGIGALFIATSPAGK